MCYIYTHITHSYTNSLFTHNLLYYTDIALCTVIVLKYIENLRRRFRTSIKYVGTVEPLNKDTHEYYYGHLSLFLAPSTMLGCISTSEMRAPH